MLRRGTYGIFAALVTLAGKAGAQVTDTPRVVMLTTGGTIASRDGAPMLEGRSLVDAVPGLGDLAAITVEEVSRIGSSRMTPEGWLSLARRINAALNADPGLAGVVVTHGTDTMEETAFFLHLTVRDPRPVVLVGSMRSATAPSADGPANLLNAVRVATAPDARGRGVVVVMNDEIHSARNVVKTDNLRVDAFRSLAGGALGSVDPDAVRLHGEPMGRHTVASEFDTGRIRQLPRVPLVADFAGFDGSTITGWVEAGVDGLVIESFAGGRTSAGAERGIAAALRAGVPVVVSSRVPAGRITGPPEVEGAVLARDLPAHKARILLMLALASGVPAGSLQNVFDRY